MKEIYKLRKLILICLCFLIAFTLCACSSKQNKVQPSDNNETIHFSDSLNYGEKLNHFLQLKADSISAVDIVYTNTSGVPTYKTFEDKETKEKLLSSIQNAGLRSIEQPKEINIGWTCLIRFWVEDRKEPLVFSPYRANKIMFGSSIYATEHDTYMSEILKIYEESPQEAVPYLT